MTRIKICGITNRTDAQAAVSAGADFLGFNFYLKSPRYIEPSQVRDVLADIPKAVGTVGVFVNEDVDRIRSVCDASGIGMVQLHGDEGPDFCDRLEFPVIKAIRIGGPDDLAGIEEYKVRAILVDSRTRQYGGSGVKPDWELAAAAVEKCERLILAGGLNPHNVKEAIRAVGPWAVDVASGIEKEPGIKDHDMMMEFIKAVRDAT